MSRIMVLFGLSGDAPIFLLFNAIALGLVVGIVALVVGIVIDNTLVLLVGVPLGAICALIIVAMALMEKASLLEIWLDMLTLRP